MITGENDKGRRLDRILRKALPDHPLPLLHRLLRQGRVFVNEKRAKADDRLDSGVKISIPSLEDAVKPVMAVKPLPCPEILFQGSGFLAVNKPVGLSVHGDNSLETMVRSFLADKLPVSLSFKPGPMHRLDKPSSGIVVFSASIEGARFFSSLLKEQKIRKTYLAIVEGNVEKEEIWEDLLIRDKKIKKTFVLKKKSDNGKDAFTKIKPLSTARDCTLVIAQIATGRTHQIRAQAAEHGHVLLGDKKYGSNCKGGFFLHAWKMEFLDISITAVLPQRFVKKIEGLFGKDIFNSLSADKY
jgi:23S rRNA pseudouridine955/2504/2580 synthase